MTSLIKYDFKNTRKFLIRSVLFIAFGTFLANAGIMSLFMIIGVGLTEIYLTFSIANTFRDEFDNDSGYMYFSLPRRTEIKLFSKALIGAVYSVILIIVLLGTQYLLVEWNEFGFLNQRTGMDMLKDIIPYNTNLVGEKNIITIVIAMLKHLVMGVHGYMLIFLAMVIERKKKNTKKTVMDKRAIGNTWIIRYGIMALIVNSVIDFISKLMPFNYMPNGIDVGINFTKLGITLLVGIIVNKYTSKIIDNRLDL